MIRILGFAGCLVLAAFAAARGPARDHRTANAAGAFLASLTPELRAKAAIPFDDSERRNWHYVPRERRGVRTGELSKEQRAALDALLSSALSEQGLEKVEGVFALELLLFEQESRAEVRDPGNYFVSVFGDPGGSRPWGWRIEGHHLSLNFSSVSGEVAVTPHFLGANPIRLADWRGTDLEFRVLGSEEDRAREFVAGLSADERARAVRDAEAPYEILLTPGSDVDALVAEGLAADTLSSESYARLLAVAEEFARHLRGDLAEREIERVRAADRRGLLFLWIGSTEPGEPFYFRVQGPHFVIEYMNGRPGADHVHAIWRDRANDFGTDTLRRHLATEHDR